MANSPGVRKYLRSARRAISALARVAPGASTGRMIIWAVISQHPYRHPYQHP
jgi:hypothetical protein